MVNQWGRDGNVASGSAGSSRSGGGILIPAIVALVIGAGGGYAGARFFSGVSPSDIESRDKKIAELNQALSEIRFDSQGVSSEQKVLRERVSELESQLAAANRTKDTLRSDVDRQVARAQEQALAEIEALQKTLDEAGNLNGELGRARKSLKVSELQIIDLEKTVGEQKKEMDRLEAQARRSASEVGALKKTNADLATTLAEARIKLKTIPKLEDEIATLREQLSEKTADAGDSARARIETLQEEVSSLKTQLDDLAKDLSEKTAAAADAARDLKKANAAIKDREANVARLSAEKEALTERLASAEKELAALRGRADDTDMRPADGDKGSNDEPADSSLTPRNRDAVERAVADLPGYDALPSGKRQMLLDMLERGECVTDSLKAAYGHVSPIALRSLFRDLGGRC